MNARALLDKCTAATSAVCPAPSTAIACLGADAPLAHQPAHNKYALAGIAGGGVAGGLLWSNHPVLGFLLGASVGNAAASVVEGGDERTAGLCELGVTAAGVGGALLWERHPVLGYLGGALAGVFAAQFVPGVQDAMVRTGRRAA